MIRLMREDDIPAIRRLECMCFSDAWSEALLREGLGSGLDMFWVLTADDEDDDGDAGILGYANLRVIAGEGEIMRIAVRPDFRGRGLGRKLMEQMAVSAREQGAADITLEVRAGNKTAINLYESCGFVAEAVRKGYYKEPAADGLIMWNRGLNRGHTTFTT